MHIFWLQGPFSLFSTFSHSPYPSFSVLLLTLQILLTSGGTAKVLFTSLPSFSSSHLNKGTGSQELGRSLRPCQAQRRASWRRGTLGIRKNESIRLSETGPAAGIRVLSQGHQSFRMNKWIYWNEDTISPTTIIYAT